jgi:chromosome segregation ATPase
MGSTQEGLQRYFTGFGQQLAELDTRTTGYLVDLDRRSTESFGRLQTGVDIIAAMPEQLSATEGMLAAQVEAARQEIARLRSDLIEIGREVHEQVNLAAGSTTGLLNNLQEAGMNSRLMAEQIEQTSANMGVAAESAWQAIRSAVADSTTGMGTIVQDLAAAENRTTALTQLAQSSVSGLLEKVADMSRLLDASLTRINYNYEQLAKGGFNALSELTRELDTSANRLSESTELARAQLGAASAVVDKHQSSLSDGTQILAARLADVKGQLETLRDGFSGLDARLEHVGPALSGQQEKLDGFLQAVDRTLNQVGSLQGLSRQLASEHLELAAKVQENEARLMQSASILEGKLGNLDTALSGAVLARLVQAAEHAQTVEGYLGRLTTQAGKLDGALVQVKTSLEQDVASLQNAERGISQVAENTAAKMLEAGAALTATLGQLQRGGQLSHTGLMQTNEETQRLVVRLEQVRALIKNMMGGISTDLNEWQSDMRRRLTGIASELARPGARASIPPLPAPSVPRIRVAAGGVATTSTQLTTEALHAVAVDLYRLLQTEVPELKRSLMPPAARRSPMTPDDARTYTLTLLEQNNAALSGFVRDLYRQNIEFHQYVDRYLARFEAQYDVLARSPQGLTESASYRGSDVGRLYELIAGAIERKSIAAKEAV